MSVLSEAYGDPFPDGNCRPFRQMFLDAVAEYPNNLALACVHQPVGLYNISNQPLDGDEFRRNPYLRWNYKDLGNGIERCVSGLRAAGVKPGMPVFTFNTNGAEHVLLYWATCEIGCVFVPINPRNLANKEEVAHMVKTASSVVPGKRFVLVTSSPDLGKPLEELGIFQDSVKIIVAASQPNQDWITFESIMTEHLSDDMTEVNGQAEDKVVDGFVLFTSGTTSMPKACFRQYPAFNHLFEDSLRQKSQDGLEAGDRVCGVLPNNHAMGHFWILFAHSAGAAMVYPGPTFQTDVMLQTLHWEKISHTVLVPTMMHALIGLKAVMGHKLNHLKSVTFGGALLTPDNLRSCINELGTKGVENGFGMTEGIVIRSSSQRDPSTLIDGEEISVGWVRGPMGIRIADPDTNKVLPRNTLGELHGSAPSVDYYVGDVGRESFYNDPDGRLWFKTGDQARMDGSGRLFITGRYKEMIIRGGENISPTAIEAAITKDSRLAALNPQVVATPDPIAGEVPVAVVMGKVDADVREAVQNAVLTHMGTIYVPEDVISLEELQLQDYPRTMAGKIQKTKLAALVKSHRKEQDFMPLTIDDSKLAVEVRDIWAKAVGLEPHRLSLNAQIGEFADSITVMRVRDTIKRKTGKTLSLVEMANAGTVSGHIELLQKRSNNTSQKKENKRTVRDGPPGAKDMVHVSEDSDLLEPTKEVVLKAISPHGLEWSDVEDVIPSYDFGNMMMESGLFHSWGFKFSMVAEKANKQQLRIAFEMLLQNNRMLASFLVRDELAFGSDGYFHVLVRQNKKFFDTIFSDGGKVQGTDELRAKSLDYQGQVSYSGPLARAVLYDVEETGTSGVVFCLDHAVVDASTGLIFSADLDKALATTAPLSEHVDYKLWAESYYNQRTSAAARAATKWHIRRLGGIENHRKSLWPPFTMPRDANQYVLETSEEDAVYHDFEADSIREFRQHYPHITATVLIKAALSLLTINRTRQSHALFANLEAARTTFPFLPKFLETTGQFEATDVSGPTIQSVTNFVEYRPDETVLSFLERMQEDQLNLTKYASAPVREIMSSLGEAGDLIPKVLGHHLFNWVPGMGTTGTNPNQNFEPISATVRPRLGLSWNAGLGGPNGNTFFITVRGVSFDKNEQKQLALELENITKWLLAKNNWESATKGFTAALAEFAQST